jgi:hypothetical protein
MGWFGKLAFGSLGMFLGGPLGAIAGAALGHHLVDKGMQITETGRPKKLEQTQAAYFVSFKIYSPLPASIFLFHRQWDQYCPDRFQAA